MKNPRSALVSAEAEPRAPKLLVQVREALRARHYSRRTEEAYVGWARRYVKFHRLRHPAELGAEEIRGFLTALATQAELSASSQTQALSALLFLYRRVLHRPPGDLGDLVRARRPGRLPVVLTRDEVRLLLDRLEGVSRVVCVLLYGSGLRLLEALQLRVKDVDFAGGEIRVRRAKGARDRVTVLPGALTVELERHLERVRQVHQRDLARGAAGRRCRRRSSASHPARRGTGAGSTCSRPAGSTSTPRATPGGTIFMSRWSSGRCAPRPRRRASRSG